jgi:hypothetical protein
MGYESIMKLPGASLAGAAAEAVRALVWWTV